MIEEGLKENEVDMKPVGDFPGISLGHLHLLSSRDFHHSIVSIIHSIFPLSGATTLSYFFLDGSERNFTPVSSSKLAV